MAEFTHHISLEQYVDGLRTELRAATTKEHKAAIQAELESLAAATAAPRAAETA